MLDSANFLKQHPIPVLIAAGLFVFAGRVVFKSGVAKHYFDYATLNAIGLREATKALIRPRH